MGVEEDWKQLEFESPDGRSRLILGYESEIRFGPAYYRATLDGLEVPERVFGRKCAWSADSGYVALELWNSTEESRGPDTSLFLIRVDDRHFYDRPRVRRGFLDEIRFEGEAILYTKDCSRTRGTVEQCEMRLGGIQGWKPLRD